MADEPTEPAPSKPPAVPRFRRNLDHFIAETAIQRLVGEKTGRTVDWLQIEARSYADELAGPDPTPLERTLADTAALCWLALRLAESIGSGGGNLSIAQAAWNQRRIDHCHRRFLATLRTLATVRKLALPALQFNIGTHQVNTAGG